MARKLYDGVCVNPECGKRQDDVFSSGPDQNGHLEGCRCEVCNSPVRARLIAAIGRHGFDLDALTGSGRRVDFLGGTGEENPSSNLDGNDVGTNLAQAVRDGSVKVTGVKTVQGPDGSSAQVITTTNQK